MSILQGVYKIPIQYSILVGVPFAALAARSLKRRADKDQGIRDARASGLLDQIARGEAPRFSLYLRTFAVTGVLSTGRRVLESVTPLSVGPVLDFETLLAEVVERDAPLMALGCPGEHLGAGRIATEESSWRADILQLAKHAVSIFVIPSGRPGTAWEIDTIVASDLWNKSVFLMPPGLSGELAKTWNADRDRLAASGITIPKYLPLGMAFTLDHRGQVNGRVDLDKLEPAKLAGAIRQARAEAESTPDIDVRGVLDGSELVVSKHCPKCGGKKLRPRTPEEQKAMKSLVNEEWDGSSELDTKFDDFSNRATCADCGTTYKRDMSVNGGLICFILSVIAWVFLAPLILSSGAILDAIHEVTTRPTLSPVFPLALGLLYLLFFGALGLAFPVWFISALVERIRPRPPGPRGVELDGKNPQDTARSNTA